MHIYVAVRGLISAVKQWENFMSSQYLPIDFLEKGKKKPNKYLAQLQVREIKMYEIVCPEGSEDVVMGMLKPTKGHGGMDKLIKPFQFLGKMMGLKKCSENWKPALLPNLDGMNIIALGTKEDKLNWKEKPSGNNYQDIGTPRENL